MNVPSGLWDDVQRHGDYFFAHLTPIAARGYLAAGAWPGQLVPLHQAGCTPRQLGEYRQIGIGVNHAIEFRKVGWSADYIAAAGLPVDLVLGYLRCGITSALHVRRLNGLHALPARLRQLGGLGQLDATLQTVLVLDEQVLVAEGAYGPVRFVFRDGILAAATEDDRHALEDEAAISVLGGKVRPSRAVELQRLWARGLGTNWTKAAKSFGVTDDPNLLALRWVKTLLAAPTTRFDGHAPAIRLLRRPPRCAACIERAAFVAHRDLRHEQPGLRHTA
jgi:hypothetical protein